MFGSCVTCGRMECGDLAMFMAAASITRDRGEGGLEDGLDRKSWVFKKVLNVSPPNYLFLQTRLVWSA